jgi:ABC-type nickel/cobalt efflux system permease component RcnA
MYNIIKASRRNINFWGVTLTENLKWHAHIDMLRKSLNCLSCILSISFMYGIIFLLTDSHSKKVVFKKGNMFDFRD